MQPTNNRTPDKVEASTGDSVDEATFEPGASFTDEPAEQSGSGELPSWLQNFGGVTGEQSGSDAPQVVAGSEPQTAPARPEAPPAPVGHSRPVNEPVGPFGPLQGSGDSSFFSEDDLPEWLRALSTDSVPSPAAAPVMAVATDSVVPTGVPNGATHVPPVSRAWVTASDQQELSPGANLLSSLVHATDSRPEADAVASTGPAPAPRSSAKASAQPKVAAQPPAGAPVATEVTQGSGRWSRTRILAVVAIIVLLLLVIIMQIGN